MPNPYPMQYLGYCTVCNFFNPSHSIDLMLKNWTTQSDTSASHVTLFFSTQFLLSLFFMLTPIQKFQKLSLTLSLPTEHASKSISLSLSCLKKSHQWCSDYLSTEEWMWTNNVSATHPTVIRSGNQIYEKKNFFAKDHPFVSFIALKIIYFFHCFYLFIFNFQIWFIYCWMFLRFL